MVPSPRKNEAQELLKGVTRKGVLYYDIGEYCYMKETVIRA